MHTHLNARTHTNYCISTLVRAKVNCTWGQCLCHAHSLNLIVCLIDTTGKLLFKKSFKKIVIKQTTNTVVINVDVLANGTMIAPHDNSVKHQNSQGSCLLTLGSWTRPITPFPTPVWGQQGQCLFFNTPENIYFWLCLQSVYVLYSRLRMCHFVFTMRSTAFDNLYFYMQVICCINLNNDSILIVCESS